MIFSRSYLRLENSFRSRSISSCSQLLITKKAVYFDYVGIDVSGLVGNALRLAKSTANEQRRQREVGRQVLHSVQQLLRKINCKKSLLFAMDGAESLAKACVTRRSSFSRRLESRLVRLPGTTLMQTVEESLVRMMPENQLRLLPSEVVISGTGVSGCVEEKFSAWALDLACREGFNANQDSLCLIGSSELFLNTLAMTPYYDIRSVVQGTSDMKQTTMSSLLEWLELDGFATKGDSTLVARARTDALFLYLICSGCTATELPSSSHARFSILWDRYYTRSFERSPKGESSAGAKPTPSGGSQDENASFYLFTDTPDHMLELDLENFFEILGLVSADTVVEEVRGGSRGVSKRNASTPVAPHATTSVSLTGAGNDTAAGGYLEHALQSHAMFCLGYTPNPFYVPPNYDGLGDAQERGVPIRQLALHLKALIARGVRKLRARVPSFQERGQGLASSDKGSLQEESESISPAQDRVKEGEMSKEGASSMSSSPPVADEARESGEAGGALESGTSSTPCLPSDVNQENPFWSPIQPLTAAEYTILCQVQQPNIESGLQLYVGRMPKPELAKRILRTTDIRTAHQLVQEALSYADPERPHKCLCLSPSYCWLQSDKTKLWRMEYVDIGVLARAQGIRRVRNAISGMSMELRASEGGSAWFDFQTQLWQPIPRFPCGGEEPIPDAAEAATDSEPTRAPPPSEDPRESRDSGKTIKVLTWNVMFDRYSGQPTPLGMPGIDWCSPQRYPVLAKCIAAEDADVVGMQEVEPAFLRYLAAQRWCREGYFLSCTESSPVIHPWGVAMLIHRRRLPVVELTHVNVPAWSGHVSLMPVVTLRMSEGATVHVSAVHLLAPFTKAHENARTAQDLALRQRLVKSVPATGDSIAMGDFNDYPGNEFLMPRETQYLECWPMLHPQDPGRTMDDTNTFCKLKVEEMFFGRSDKIFLRSRRLVPIEAHLVGTKSVNEENGDGAAPAYLFPSDHYGVSMTFALKSTP
ncbi:unnamed protein product [Phytomonas sp. EM1]|nr:unnamed protein product [Phytomonas sp. EM1]|eukprot:CCW64129.1 unnamed protein product [Phytomonas sp. isolate EM1]